MARSKVSASGPWPAMQLCRLAPPGTKAFGLGIVGAEDQAHEFVHQVAMEPRRTEGVLGDHPTRRKDREVAVGGAGNVGRRGQHRVDGWIGMIERNGVDAVEEREIVFVGRVVAVPCDDIERRVIDEGAPQAAQEFGDDVELAVAIFEGGDGRFEIARIGEAVGADGAEFGQAERQAVVLADVAAGLACRASSTRNLTPRGMTQISPGATSRMPSSVWKRSAPSCGTISISPSALEKKRSCIEALAA